MPGIICRKRFAKNDRNPVSFFKRLLAIKLSKMILNFNKFLITVQ